MMRNVPVNRNQDANPANSGSHVGRQLGTKEFLGIVIRRRWIILGILIPIVLMALLATMTSTASVTAATRVVVETSQPESPTFYNQRVDYDVLMSTASQIVVSIPVAERAALALFDSIPSFIAEFPEFGMIESVHDVRDILLELEDCNQVGETNILEITVSHPSGRFALMAVDAITTAYIGYSIERQRIEPAVQYYSDQIAGVKAEVDSLSALRADVLSEYGLIAFKENAQSNAAQIVEMERQYFTARSSRQSVETRLKMARQAVADNPLFVPSVSIKENNELIMLKRMVDEEETKLTRLRAQYLDDSVWVTRQQDVVQELQEKFLAERNNVLTSLEIEFETAMARELSIKESVAQQKEMIRKYPEIQKQLSSLDVSITSQMDLMEVLQTKRGEVRLKADTDARISSIIPLDTPSLAGFIGGGKKAVYLSMACIFGLVLGLVVALFVDNQDHRIFDGAQIQEYLELPVLGSISNADKK